MRILITGAAGFLGSHLVASPASPVDHLEMPIQTLEVGSLGTLNTFGVANAKV